MLRTILFSSAVAAPPDDVWARVTTPEGINDELGPVLTMRMPSRWRGARIEDLPLDRPLGRAWLLLFGVVPVDCDTLRLTEVEPGRMFQERSTLVSANRWEHRRTLTPLSAGGTRVDDQVRVECRLARLTPLLAWIVTRLFRHRHRRLRARFGAGT